MSGMALGYKFPGVQGISTRGQGGGFEITKWPTQEQFDAAGVAAELMPGAARLEEIQAEYETYLASIAYIKNRVAEYPSIGDQLDAIWKQIEADRADGKALESSTDIELEKVLAVKARNPKP